MDRKRLGCGVLVLLLAGGVAGARDPGPVPTGADFRRIVRQAKAKVFPAVVFVKCVREGHETGKRESQEVSGSGVIISHGGEVLTNWHVVEKAVSVRCLLYDGRAFTAKVLGQDKDIDLAMLQLEGVDGDPFDHAEIGDSNALEEGDFVMAMGAPWGMSRSVSIGIVSCVRRYLPDHSEYSLWLQTDAAISPGNSGGPLVNTDGQVVGINTRGVMVGGDMGFAIPSDTMMHFVSQIRDHGKVDWSWTGLQLQPLRDFNRDIYFDADHGVMVAGTDPDSPAETAGLRAKDRVVKVNGAPVDAMTEEDLPHLRRLFGMLTKDAPADVELIRGGETVRVQLTPREKGRVEGEELDCPRWDLTVKTINQFDNPELHFHCQEGVFIYGIKMPGNASSSNLQEHDIILSIDGKAVKTLQDVKDIHTATLAEVASKHRILFTVLRNGLMRQVVLDFAREYDKE